VIYNVPLYVFLMFAAVIYMVLLIPIVSVDVHFGDRQWFEHGMSVVSISQPFYALINNTCYLRYIVKYWEVATWLDSHVGRDNFSHF
jgi:hypothetical protein